MSDFALDIPGVLLLCLLPACLAGNLDLKPNLQKAILLAGEDNSFFISCLPFSAASGPLGDSKVIAKQFAWKRRQGGEGAKWVVMGTQPHDRVHVEPSGDGRNRGGPGYGRGLDLVFRSIRTTDSGLYSCEAILDEEHVKTEFELKVIEPISFDLTNAVQRVEEGANEFLLRCNVSGNPRPDITWNVRGSIVRSGKTPKYDVIENGLLIYNITKEDQGHYKCKATQFDEGITDFKDMVILLKVEHAPELPPEQRGEFYGFISGVTNLTCEARAEPPAEFSWLDEDDNAVTEGTIVNEGHRSTLMLPVNHFESFGDYKCIARNKMGSLEKVVTLSEGAKPGIPYIDIIKITHEAADARIEKNKAEMFLDIVGFKVEITERDRPDWNNATVFYFQKNDSNIYHIDGLMPKTLYLFRAKAKNLAGFSDSSNVIYLRTKAPHTVGELLQSGSGVSRVTLALSILHVLLTSLVGRLLMP